ncbi:MAG: FAD:protein FMN transferase [Chloroflexota bacterium]
MMTTQIEAKAYGRTARAALDEVFERLADIDRRMGTLGADSEIAKVNANAGIQPVKVSDDTFLVIQRALEYARKSEGKFDITVQPVVNLWGIGSERAKVPSASELAARVALVGYQQVQLDEANHTVYLPVKGMGIDLGGIAKGYAADEADRIMAEHRVKNALMNLGDSSIYLEGGRPGGQPWRIGIQDPENLEAGYIGIIEAADEALSTSGAYERFFIENGKRYHHIIDPASGMPAESDVLSATIISKQAIDGDALSTSVFILGRERGMAMIEQQGLDCIVITKDHAIWLTPGLEGRFELTSGDYHYATR